jgi:hypothetical protein
MGGGGRSSQQNTARQMTARDAPPTARSARGGAGIPPDAPRMHYNGQDWVQLWDPDESAWYWYCEATQFAQWETPGADPSHYSYGIEEERPTSSGTNASDSGYESAGAMTDYSTDGERANDWSDSEFTGDTTTPLWQEYWDEQAQAKYWYCAATVITYVLDLFALLAFFLH